MHGAAHHPHPQKDHPHAHAHESVLLDRFFPPQERCSKTHGHQQQGVLGYLESDDLSGDGAADIGAEDDADGLRQGHDVGSDETHHQHRSHRGGLYAGRDECSGQRPGEAVGSQPGEDILQAVTGPGLERIGQLFHAEQKQGQTTHQPHAHGKDVELTRSGRVSVVR